MKQVGRLILIILVLITLNSFRALADGQIGDTTRNYDTASVETLRKWKEADAEAHFYEWAMNLKFWETLKQSAIVFSIILLSVIYLYRYKSRLRQRNYLLNIQRLTTEAKGKLHNIRNNYTSFINLIDTDKFQDVREYAENSAYYFSQTLDVGDNDLWTIAQELNLMSAFYNAEKIIRGNVNISKLNFNTIDINLTLCMPEMFSTILHNAMKHAFKDKSGERIFSISAKHTDKLVVYEFVDNGIAGEIGTYFSRPESGLSILRKRCVPNCFCQKWRKKFMIA